MNRVVVTGIGVIAPGSIGKDAFWKNISSARVFTDPVTMFDCGDLRVRVAGEIKEFKDDDPIESKNGVSSSELERIDKLAIKTFDMAIKDSGISTESDGNIAVSLGTTMGKSGKFSNRTINYTAYEDLLSMKNSPDTQTLRNFSAGSVISNVCKYFNLKNSQTCMFLNACAAGNYSIGWGYDKIKNADAEIAIVGGVESLSLTALIGFNRLLSLSSTVCRPFDKKRKGLIVSEGCAVLILEELNSALRRCAHIYGEIKGYGLSVDAYHITIPKPDASGAISCMKEALKKSSLCAGDVDYVSAHGTGTKLNDEIECKALCAIFGDRVPPTGSIKSMIGHSLGAAASIEAVASLLMIQNSEAVPTANFETVDEKCPIDCIPNKSRKMKINNIMSNSFAFGGNNSCMVISKYERGDG